MNREILTSSRVKAEKRGKLDIYYDILSAFQCELIDATCLTRVAHRTNMPYDRFRGYLDHLIQLDLLSRRNGGKLLVTEKGLEYINEYGRISDFLRRMGLSP